MYYKRKDANHNQIVWELRQLGFSVFELHNVGGSFPDIIVGWEGNNYLFEIKTEKGRLSKVQKEFFAFWKGNKFLIHSSQEALEYIKLKQYQRKSMLLMLSKLEYVEKPKKKKIKK